MGEGDRRRAELFSVRRHALSCRRRRLRVSDGPSGREGFVRRENGPCRFGRLFVFHHAVGPLVLLRRGRLSHGAGLFPARGLRPVEPLGVLYGLFRRRRYHRVSLYHRA